MNKKEEDIRTRALQYHKMDKPGKTEIKITKPCSNAQDLSLAYTPGVAYPCLEIEKNPEDAYNYTAKGNLVGVISNGTAVLGLGNIGALASKPVMEGKAVLFKKFAKVDAFDIEINETDPAKLVEIIAGLEPTFGGINLEDIKAPDCFQVEKELIKRLNIPVFHDDQHGTAIIVAAALKNSLELVGKEISSIKLVVSGAGSAAMAICHLLLELGLKKENIFMHDSQGLIIKSRGGLNEYKKFFAQEDGDVSLSENLRGADVFIGVSAAGVLSQEMVSNMSSQPIIFAMANPHPEILPAEVKAVAPDAIVATGRSDYANQVNNVLCFPYIFRGALDVRATEINMAMKLAAVEAIAKLAHEDITSEVRDAYAQEFAFGPNYIIPKPFDSRLLYYVSAGVAKAAMETGVAKNKIDIVKYIEKLKKNL